MSGDKLNDAIQKLMLIYNSEIGVIDVIDLVSNLPIDQVTDIFNRINQKGTRLSSADFAMSRLSSDLSHHGNDLRKEIDYFIQIYRDKNLADNIKKMMSNLLILSITIILPGRRRNIVISLIQILLIYCIFL